MPIRFAAALLGLALLSTGCTKEYDCDPVRLRPAFIGFPLAELKTLVIRRYEAHDNFRTLLDTVVISYGGNGTYYTSFDTTFVGADLPILREGNDWQIRLPATGRTVRLTDIVTEQRTGKETHGIFSLDPGPRCINNLVSAQLDGQPVPLKVGPFGTSGGLYIRK